MRLQLIGDETHANNTLLRILELFRFCSFPRTSGPEGSNAFLHILTGRFGYRRYPFLRGVAEIYLIFNLASRTSSVLK